MSNEISLQKIEKKVFITAFQDGLIDIGLGLFLLMFVIGPYLTPYLGDWWGTLIFVPFWLIAFLILWWVKRNIVKPRIGTVKYGPWRKSRMIRFNVFIFITLTLAFILGILSVIQFETLPGWVHTARFSMVFLISFGLAGYFLEFNRLYIYGFGVALAPLVGEALYQYVGVPHHGFPITFGAISILMLLTGLVLFRRLLLEHPLDPSHQETAE